mmetsp:Transcript_30694/g.59198  ORF Transcript_30694/g.59198 Transcript_30694/m.59198 type:complete len:207 (-) Transcript_30694:158-778(-)
MFKILGKIGDAVAPQVEGDGPRLDADGYPDETPALLRELRRVPRWHELGSPMKRLEMLSLALPPSPEAAGFYRPLVVVGDMVFVSGQLPFMVDGKLHKGKVATTPGTNEVDEEAAVQAAKAVGLTTLALLKKELGTLDVIARCVKANGYVNCSLDFEAHAKVLNGFSELMVEVFGEAGRGARAAVGVSSLPFNITVEVESMFQLRM